MFNTWTRNSGIINAGNPAQASWMMRSFQVNSTGGTMYIDDYMIIDLTEAFGSGNEPEKAWCDTNIRFFEGTASIKYIK